VSLAANQRQTNYQNPRSETNSAASLPALFNFQWTQQQTQSTGLVRTCQDPMRRKSSIKNSPCLTRHALRLTLTGGWAGSAMV